MADILEKYKLLFSYDNGTTTVSSISVLLSYYLNGVAINHYADIYNRVKYSFNYYKSGDRDVFSTKNFAIRITDEAAQIICKAPEIILEFPETVFTLPVDDLLLILQSWGQFLNPYKMRNVEVKNGAAIIDIITDGFVTALVIEKAVAAHWPDCGGSVGEYYSVSTHDYEKQKELTNDLNNAVLKGTDAEVLAAIEIFLRLFANGKYSVVIGVIDIGYAEIAHDQSMIYSDHIEEDNRFTYQTYPSFDDNGFLFSRAMATVDSNRVAEYVKLIKGGLRPKVVVYQGYDYEHSGTPYYVIDGHHKLLAYIELGIQAACVFINKTETTDKRRGNITPQLIGVLRPNELMHVLQENDNIEDVEVFTGPEMTSYVDKILSTQKNIDLTIARLLYNTYNSTDENIAGWARERLLILAKNKYQGKGQVLYYKDNENKYASYRCLFIENLNDFHLWKQIFLEDGKIPDRLAERQKETSERYYPPYRPPVFPNPPPVPYPGRGFANDPPGDMSSWRIISRILLICMALMAVLKACK